MDRGEKNTWIAVLDKIAATLISAAWLRCAGPMLQPIRDLQAVSVPIHARSIGISSLPIAFFLLLFALVAGCQRKDASIAGVDIPVPSQMKRVTDKVTDAVPGFEDGQAAFQGKATEGEILRFYQENMEARRWKPTNYMVSKKGQLAFTRDGKICLVWYTPDPNGTTSLVIMVGPSEPPPHLPPPPARG